MRATAAILAFLGTAASCCAENLFDEAGRALSRGQAGPAAALYQRANAEQPTAEGYNNLGVALERAGQFALAKEAYGLSLQLPHASDITLANARRARLRAAVQAAFPYAASAFAGMLAFFTLGWLVKHAKHAWRAWRLRMRFWRVRVSSFTHCAQCGNGEYQPDSRVYGDSEGLFFKAGFTLPSRQDIYPLQLELQVIRPNGTVWRTLQESIAGSDTCNAIMSFQVSQLRELLECSGRWRARLVLQNIRKQLSSMAFTVVTRDDLVADLEAVKPRLIAIKGKEVLEGNVIFSDVEALVPRAVIRPRRLHPSKFQGINIRLDLVNLDKEDEIESTELPLQLTDCAMDFCSVSRPVAGNDIARKVGKWEFRLAVGERILAQWPFVITTFEQALESLRLESFGVAGVRRSGQPVRIGKVAYMADLRGLCPVARVSSRFPSRRIGYHMCLGVCVDGEPTGGVEGKLIMDGSSVELMPGELKLPPFPEGRESMQVNFVLLVEGRTLGIHEVTLRMRPPRCADAQGRIMNLSSVGEIDYDSEAERILGRAAVFQ